MIDTRDLWRKRSAGYIKEIRVYLRYMLNDHLLIALIFLLGGAGFYYSSWLKEIPAGFPYALITAFILAFILVRGTVRTLIKEPDLVFLLAIEKRLAPYFQKAFVSSLIFESYLLMIVFAVLAPLYATVTGNGYLSLGVLFVIILLCKAWNLQMSWNIHYFHDARTRFVDKTIRFLLNFALTYLLFNEASLVFIIPIIIIMIILLVYFQRAVSKKGIKWDYLIDLESRRMMAFYRLANLFTDVPKLKERVKPRSWLNWVTTFFSYSKQNTFSYLYLRTFLRTSDYLGMYIRLTIIGGLLIYLVPLQYGKIIILMLFLYLTGYQLITLWRHHNLKIWLDIYPITVAMKTKSFLQLLLMLLFIQSIVLTGVILVKGELIVTAVNLLAGIAFSYLFVFYYVKNKLKALS